MAVTVITNLGAPRALASTIGDLLETGKYYRHPDSALISYPVVVDQTLGTFPQGPTSIAIVGGGAAGIAALYEIAQAALGNINTRATVTVFEADPDSFLFGPDVGTTEIVVKGKKAGRVSAAIASENTVYEVGAMRFPEIAGLTWHYAERVFTAEAQVKVFPNPGKVATEFVFGHRVDRYLNNSWMDDGSPTKAVKELVLHRLLGFDLVEGVHIEPLLPIGAFKPIDAAILLVNQETVDADLQSFQSDWAEFVRDNDQLTLEGAVRLAVRKYGDGYTDPDSGYHNEALPGIDGLTGQERENYYVELFGRFGFGTGGFKSLYNISYVEMMRLILWDYSNEYTLPVTENVAFLSGLYGKAKEFDSVYFRLNDPVQARVSDAFHQDNKAVLAYYRFGSEDLTIESFDYVILAMPQDQLIPLATRAGYAEQARTVTMGNGALGLGTANLPNVKPPFLLGSEAANARIVTAASMLHMTRSSKVFGTIADSHLGELPTFTPEGGSPLPIKAVISDSGLAASYIVPSTLQEEAYSSFLASYTWDDDSTRLQHDFGAYPQNPPGSAVLKATADDMFKTMINRADRDIVDPADGTYKRWWFAGMLTNIELDDRFVFDWTTNKSAGGFKLDLTGDHYQSNLCFRYHTHALRPELGNHFFIASDSYSHLGGWLEGAFMSGINAAAGVILAANGGNLTALSSQAQKLFTALDPIMEPSRSKSKVAHGKTA